MKFSEFINKVIRYIKYKTTGFLICSILLCSLISTANALPGKKGKVVKDTVATTDTISVKDSLSKQVTVRTPQDLFASCARCHSIGKGKLIGPDLAGIKDRHDSAWFVKFIRSSDSLINAGDTSAKRLFLANEKLPMPNHDFSREEIKALVDYIDFEGKKLKANPGFLDNSFSYAPRSNTWLFVVSLLLVLLSVMDMLFTKFLKYKLLNIFMLLTGLVICGKVVSEEATYLGRSLGYEPDQPVKFSHKVHAGDNKINCLYCHPGASESRYAGIPATNLCLNCHNVIRYGTNTGEEEINKIHQAVEDGKPIPWVKVYNLPDHVFFSHAQHVNAGKINCEKCHGDVAKMGRVQQVTDLSMGWCMNCHKQTEVQFSNKYYTRYKQHDELKSGKISKVTVEDIGGNNCQKCHY